MDEIAVCVICGTPFGEEGYGQAVVCPKCSSESRDDYVDDGVQITNTESETEKQNTLESTTTPKQEQQNIRGDDRILLIFRR